MMAATTRVSLPDLSPAEYKEYNQLADMMNAYHKRFRRTWRELYEACSPLLSTHEPKHVPASRIIATGLSFLEHLSLHHAIEETYLFPNLATRMPAFRPEAEPLQQHREIHKGMDDLKAYLLKCKAGELELRRSELKAILDSWRAILWTHLDDEVAQLGAEKMRLYWKANEVTSLLV